MIRRGKLVKAVLIQSPNTTTLSPCDMAWIFLLKTNRLQHVLNALANSQLSQPMRDESIPYLLTSIDSFHSAMKPLQGKTYLTVPNARSKSSSVEEKAKSHAKSIQIISIIRSGTKENTYATKRLGIEQRSCSLKTAKYTESSWEVTFRSCLENYLMSSEVTPSHRQTLE